MAGKDFIAGCIIASVQLQPAVLWIIRITLYYIMYCIMYCRTLAPHSRRSAPQHTSALRAARRTALRAAHKLALRARIGAPRLSYDFRIQPPAEAVL